MVQRPAARAARARGAAPLTVHAIAQPLDLTALVSQVAPDAAVLPLAPEVGVPFGDPDAPGDADAAVGRFAFLVLSGATDGPRVVLAVEAEGWSVACPLTSGQLHRLTNALTGRGTRSAIRPLSTEEVHVHVAGSPERLTVTSGERTIDIPAGPRRVLGKALRELETQLAA